MAQVECGDLCRPEPFGDRDDRCVDDSEREIGVGAKEAGDAGPVARLQVNHLEGAVRIERFEEIGFDIGSAVSFDEVARFGHYRNRDNKTLSVCSQPRTAALVVAVVRVEQCHEGAGIDDDQPV